MTRWLVGSYLAWVGVWGVVSAALLIRGTPDGDANIGAGIAWVAATFPWCLVGVAFGFVGRTLLLTGLVGIGVNVAGLAAIGRATERGRSD